MEIKQRHWNFWAVEQMYTVLQTISVQSYEHYRILLQAFGIVINIQNKYGFHFQIQDGRFSVDVCLSTK